MARILIAGGGTGGHVYPAISIAEELMLQAPDTELLFVGSYRGIENDLVPRAGYKMRSIKISGFQRRMNWSNVENIWNTICSLWTSKKILKEFQPQVVLGTGGYVCGPILLVAALIGIPTVIQEQNSFPGVTNRILARFARVIALGYENAAPRFAVNAHFIYTGNPVRSDFLKIDKENAYKEFGFSQNRLTILISGGSQGARSVNTAALGIHRKFAGDERVQIIHITGATDFDNVTGHLIRENLPINDLQTGRIVVPYLHNMPEAMAIADIAVSRAGAIAMAEIMLRGIPSILIPYPYAAENHQEFNARFLAERGAAVLVRDNELSGDVLLAEVNNLIANNTVREKMSKACLQFSRPDAASRIASIVLSLLQN